MKKHLTLINAFLALLVLGLGFFLFSRYLASKLNGSGKVSSGPVNSNAMSTPIALSQTEATKIAGQIFINGRGFVYTEANREKEFALKKQLADSGYEYITLGSEGVAVKK